MAVHDDKMAGADALAGDDQNVQAVTDYIHTALYGGESPDGDTNPKVLSMLQEYLQIAPGPAQAGAEVVGDLMGDAVSTALAQGVQLDGGSVMAGMVIAASEVGDVMRAEGVELTPDQEAQIVMGSVETVMEATQDSGIWDDPKWQNAAKELWSSPEAMTQFATEMGVSEEDVAAINAAPDEVAESPPETSPNPPPAGAAPAAQRLMQGGQGGQLG